VVIWSENGHFVATSPAVSEHRQSLDDQVSMESFVSGSPPQALSHLGGILELSQATITGGPTYLVPDNLQTQTSPAIDGSSLFIISSVSEAEAMTAQRRLHRPSTWELDEWNNLTDGHLGPWAMAVHSPDPESGIVGLEAVCICFSARRTPRAAEAGIWTREDFRGRRLAPTVAARWAAAERSHKDILFYSTSSDNIASQSVARRLGLQPLGWLWKLHV
jgi:RimJ/RimL family protein N-acetyltransferase